MSFFKVRFFCVVVVMTILMTLLIGRLFTLTVFQHERWAAESINNSIKSVFISAPRGEIFDRHGRLLAGNVQTFSLLFGTTNLTNAQANEIAAKVIDILEANGDSFYDNFPIVIEDERLAFTFELEIEEWLYRNHMPIYFTAEQAFNHLRELHEVPEWYDEFEAQLDLQNRLNVYPPISVRNMEFLRNMDKTAFLQRYNLRAELTAEEAFAALRLRFGIDVRDRTPDENGIRQIIRSDMSDEEARRILVIRNEVFALGFRRYIPATIASNISDETIIQVSEMNRVLLGVEIIPETERIYPHGNTASHIIGYMGRIRERDLPRFMADERYRPNDVIGLDGIEYAKESILKGTPGIRDVQVNARGELVRVLSERDPVKGQDVYLTIDIEFQRRVEEILAEALELIQVGGTFQSVHGNYRFRQFRNANVGAIVALCPNTGEIFAMASYPNFDPNEFVGGISREAWNALQSQNPRDPLAPIPLYNVAARSAQMPGSAFKMVTAAAALSSGLDPMARHRCTGFIMIGTRPFGCLIWHRGGGNHGNINLAEAIGMSCNVYFYNVALGRNLTTGRNLGFADNVSIETILHYATEFGLGVPTGIEIRETRAAIPSAESRMNQTKLALRNALRARADDFFEPEVVENHVRLETYIAEIVSWTEENPTRGELITRMADVGVRRERAADVADFAKFSYFNRATWRVADQLNIAIGQGEVKFTPLQMANFVATLGNGGTRHDVTLIHAIEGMQIERPPGRQVELQRDANFDEIVRGMRLTITHPRGTLFNIFRNFPVEVAAKTGTTEIAGRIQPPCEVEFIQANLRRLAPQVQWEDVEFEMNRLMSEYPHRWGNQDRAVRQALINVSEGRVSATMIENLKPRVDPFSWVVAMAPVDEPKIAVAVLLFQGGTSLNAGPVAREVIAEFFQLGREFEDTSLNTTKR